MMMSWCSSRNARISAASRRMSVGGIRSGNSVTKSFPGHAHPDRVVDDQRPRVDALEEEGGRDVRHVEGRILPEEHRIGLVKIEGLRFARGEVAAPSRRGRFTLSTRATTRPSREATTRSGVAAVKPVPAPLGFEHQGKRAVPGDVDAGNVVHLDRDGEAHSPPCQTEPMASGSAESKRATPEGARSSAPAFAEGVPDVNRPARGGQDDHDVEAKVQRSRRRVTARARLHRRGRSGRGRRGYRNRAIKLAAARLDLDEDQCPAAFHDEVDLADRRSIAPRRPRDNPSAEGTRRQAFRHGGRGVRGSGGGASWSSLAVIGGVGLEREGAGIKNPLGDARLRGDRTGGVADARLGERGAERLIDGLFARRLRPPSVDRRGW